MKWNQKYTKEEVALAIEMYKESGLSQKAYAEREGINVHTFKSWIVKHNKSTQSATGQIASKTSSDFIALKMEDEPEKSTYSRMDNIEIEYPNGIRITCPLNTTPEQLKTLVNL